MNGILLSLLLFSSILGAATSSLRDKTLKIIPQTISEVLTSKDLHTFRKTLSKKISSKSDESAIYLNYFGDKNDVTVGLSKGSVSYLYLELPSSLQKQTNSLYAEAMENGKVEMPIPSGSHTEGRFIVINVPSQKIQFKFYANETHDLHSVIVWPRDRK